MHICDVLKEQVPALSFEFFPPKTEESSNLLFENISHLMPLSPAYVSVTYGAGGSTRKLTQDLVVRLQKETSLTIVSHLTCVGATTQEILDLLKVYDEAGIENIMALRGDPPKGQEKFQSAAGGLVHAAELVSLIKKNFPKMGIGVAGFPEGHPETPNRLKELEHLKAKVDAGADYICTQFFFENRDFYDFRERCTIAGIKVPIIAGIMPITSRKSIHRMADLALGARFPARLLKALARADGDDYAEKVGIHWATEQVRDLIDNDVSGIHFYTLNKSTATLRIYDSLGIRSGASLQR
jgi:methylenetetrahydrofolate reductase (NADPH)